MSEDNEIHAETESEDGGIALSTGECSDEMETGHESAPTSASQSPIQPAISTAPTVSLGWLASMGDGAIASHPSSGAQPTENVAAGGTLMSLPSILGLDGIAGHDPSLSPMSPNEASFAEALSGELLNMPATTSLPVEEDTANPPSEPLGTPQAFPTSTPTPLQPSAAQAGDTSVEVNNIGPSQGSDQHVTNEHAIISLPTLTDVFGSEFLNQTTTSSHAQATNNATLQDLQEDYADFWDDMEDSIRNLQCDSFFNHWKAMYDQGVPGYPRISELANHPQKIQRRDKVLAEDLNPKKPDPPDLQGIHWSRFQTTKNEAREVRRMTYSNHINEFEDPTYNPRFVSNIGTFGSREYKIKFSDKIMPSTELYYDFRETNMRFQGYISHFQLRHNLFASSKNALIYTRRPNRGYGYGAYVDHGDNIEARIMCFNPETSADECVMDFTKRITRDTQKVFRPSTLNAGNGVLVVGSFEGAYAMKPLSASFESKPVTGVVTHGGTDGSINHIQSFLDRRSGLPQVAFSSNDRSIRILDCTTNKNVNVHEFPYPVNSSATSPDGRMRLLVGDDCVPLVANAETGEVITKLHGHTNFGFACDWASDGVTMATGHQDGFVRVWDARSLRQSVHAIPMEMAGSRTLQFSPLGSGGRVLVIAEPGDFVHVVNAQTFESKQVIEFFGEIAGISMPPDGSSLYIANQDPRYGGLMEFERTWRSTPQDCQLPQERPAQGIDAGFWETMKVISCFVNSENRKDGADKQNIAERWLQFNTWKKPTVDWLPDSDLDEDPRVMLPPTGRHRRGLGLKDVTI